MFATTLAPPPLQRDELAKVDGAVAVDVCAPKEGADLVLVVAAVRELGEAGGTQFATFNEQGLLLTGAEVATWDFRPPVGVWELEGEPAP